MSDPDYEMEFGIDEIDSDEDEIDLSDSGAETVVQDRRHYNQGLDAAVMTAKILSSDFSEVQDLLSRGFKVNFFPEEMQAAVTWMFTFFGEAQAVPSSTAFMRKFPAISNLLADVTSPADRGLIDCYAALKESAVVGCADRGILELNSLLNDANISMPDWQDRFNTLHQTLHGLTSANRSRFTSGSEIVDKAKEDYERAKRGENYGMPLPFPFLDQELMGLQPGKLMVFLGEPNVGKTWLAIMVLLTLITGNKYLFSNPAKWSKTIPREGLQAFYRDQRKYAVKVLFNSLEMTNDEIIQRMACLMANVNYSQMLRGTLSDEDEAKFIKRLDSAATLLAENVVIGHSTDLDQVITEAETFGARVIVNDAFYLFDGTAEKRWENVQAAMSRMRDHSIQTEISYVLTTQADENSKTRAMFSQAIRQDADIMVTARAGVELELTKARNAAVGTKYRYDIDPAGCRWGEQERINTSRVAGEVPHDV